MDELPLAIDKLPVVEHIKRGVRGVVRHSDDRRDGLRGDLQNDVTLFVDLFYSLIIIII